MLQMIYLYDVTNDQSISLLLVPVPDLVYVIGSDGKNKSRRYLPRENSEI